MGFQISSMGSMLKTGWDSVGNLFATPVSYALELGQRAGASIFPAPQKTTIVSSNVSVAEPTMPGYRPVTKEAQSTGILERAFTSLQQSIGSVFDNFYKFKGQAQTGSVVNTLAGGIKTIAGTIVSSGVQAISDNLPAYFADKWGLKNIDSGIPGGNSPVTPSTIIYNQQPTQSNAPATTGTLADFFKLLGMGTQPTGSYSIAYPQSSAVPVGSSVNWILIGAIALGGFFLLKKVRFVK